MINFSYRLRFLCIPKQMEGNDERKKFDDEIPTFFFRISFFFFPSFFFINISFRIYIPFSIGSPLEILSRNGDRVQREGKEKMGGRHLR